MLTHSVKPECNVWDGNYKEILKRQKELERFCFTHGFRVEFKKFRKEDQPLRNICSHVNVQLSFKKCKFVNGCQWTMKNILDQNDKDRLSLQNANYR